MGRRYSGAQTTKGRSAFDLPQGFPTVAKPELGTKRLCASCSAKFYDLNHDPITCPKCGAVHEVAPVRQRGGRPDVPARPVAQERGPAPPTPAPPLPPPPPPRLTWPEREFVRQLGERLYGKRQPTEVRHG